MSPDGKGWQLRLAFADDVRRYAASARGAPTALRIAARADPLAFLALGWLVLESLPDDLVVGSVSAGAVLSAVSALVIAAAAAHAVRQMVRRGRGRHGFLQSRERRVPLVVGAFLAWAVVMILVHPSLWGFQNVTVYASFVLAMFATSRLASLTAVDDYLRRCSMVGLLVSVVYLATVAVAGPGTSAVYAGRSVALGLVVMLAVVSTGRAPLWWSLCVLAAITLSSSRTATVAAVVVLSLSWAFRGHASHRGRRIFVLLTLGVFSAVAVVLSVPPLRHRFLGGDAAVHVHGLMLNTSGRVQVWSYTWHLAMAHRWLGAGPGAAENAINHRFDGLVVHPHNDYLRLFNDLGLLGLALFVVGVVILMRRVWVRASRSSHPVHGAAFLGFAAVAVCALTDNVLVYPFIMIPLGVLVGMSLAEALPTRSVASEEQTAASARISTAEVES